MTNNNWPVHSFTQALQRLPFEAQRRYRNLAAMVTDSQALVRSAMERLASVDQELWMKEQRLARLDPRHESDTVATCIRERDHLRQERDELEAQRNVRNGMRANAEQVLSQLQVFIPRLIEIGAGGPLRVVTATAQPRQNETLKDAILRTRRAIADLKAELNRLRIAPPTPAEIRAAIVAEVDAAAARGAPRVSVEHGVVRVHFADVVEFANPGAPMSAPSGSGSAFQCWLHHDEVVAALTAGIDDKAKGGISKQQRQATSREVEQQIFQLETDEESLIVEAVKEGMEVHRRHDANPLVWLGLEVEQQQAAPLMAAE
jgi:hypothetical protein